jgi:hypothetical protein
MTSTTNLVVTTAGTFQFQVHGGGGAGGPGNGYNAFGRGGVGGGIGTITAQLAAGNYLVTIGGGGTGSVYPSNYSTTAGTASSVVGFTAGAEIGAGGATNLNTAGLNANGVAGTDVSTFIGGSALFKSANGGNANTGVGGSSVGGNGASGVATAGSAAANTASGGGGAGGAGLPDLFTGNSGAGGSGIVYVRWFA